MPLPAWLEHAPLPTGVIRDGRFVYVNEALARLLDRPAADIVGLPLTDPVAPEDRERIRERHQRRTRGEAVPESHEFRVVRADGAVRTVEIFVSSHEDVTIFQLCDRSDRALRLQRLEALVRLGVAVQAERDDEHVFGSILEGLHELGLSTTHLVRDAKGLRVVDMRADPQVIEGFARGAGTSILGYRGRWAPALEQAWKAGSAFVDDLPLASTQFVEPSAAATARDVLRAHDLDRAVVLRIDVGGAPAHELVIMGSWVEPDDVPTFRLLGAQISAALDAARAIADLSARNASLAVIDRIAAVASSASTLEDLFARSTDELRAVLRCDGAAIFLVDEEAGFARLAYAVGASPEAEAALATIPLQNTTLGRIARQRATRVLAIEEFGPETRAVLEPLGHKIVVSVPFVARGRVVGVMNVSFTRERAVPADELELVQAAGAHLASAVEAQRLLLDLRKSYADLAHTQEQLVQRERLAAIGELAAVVAHEVRNPLGVIFNSIGTIRRMLGTDERAWTLIRILEEEATRLNHIVGDLLDFARPRIPTVQRERIETVLDDAVAAALAGIQNVALEREVDADLPPVPMDARLMRQALLNVAQNAVQAMMPKGGTLRVGARRDNGHVRVSITDTGAGIAPDVRPRIFEPFFTTRARGTGLGLAVVKRIVDGHGGGIVLVTEVGRGTTFSFDLPLEPDR